MALRVALAGGGTGGHAYPVVAVAAEIKKVAPEAKFLWIGSKTGPEAKIAEQAQISFVSVSTGKMRRYFSFKNFSDILKVPVGILGAYTALGTIRPHVLFAKGGFASYPVVFAAWLRDIPVILHETDSVPGMANRRLLNKATLIATSFKESLKELPKGKTVFTGQPIRQELLSGQAENARQKLSLSGGRPILLILGGSQGASSINNVIYKLLPDLIERFQIIHQVGPNNVEEAKEYEKQFGSNGYRPMGFITDDLADIYAVADVIIGRAGGSIHEFAALGKPVVLLPLAAAAGNHQVHNAQTLVSNKAAVSLEEANLTPSLLKAELFGLIDEASERLRIGNNIKKFAAPLSTQKIVYWTLKLAQLR